jgi:hypothetical protein
MYSGTKALNKIEDPGAEMYSGAKALNKIEDHGAEMD